QLTRGALAVPGPPPGRVLRVASLFVQIAWPHLEVAAASFDERPPPTSGPRPRKNGLRRTGRPVAAHRPAALAVRHDPVGARPRPRLLPPASGARPDRRAPERTRRPYPPHLVAAHARAVVPPLHRRPRQLIPPRQISSARLTPQFAAA